VRSFCVDQTDALGLGAPEQLEPMATAAGPIAVPIDWATVGLLWDEHTGYPAHPAYRDYHHRTTYDLRPWANSGAAYDPAAARAVATGHARDFLRRVAARLESHRVERGRPGLLCCPVDTELLGHWWYEGQTWLATVLAEATAHGVDLLPLSRALERVEPAAGRDVAASTWGASKDLTTWDSPRVAELDLVAAARGRNPPPRAAPALVRAARELIALQSSDWAFLLTRELSGDYPLERARGHARELEAALGAALTDSGPEVDPNVRNLAPELDLRPLRIP
jgi:1,4-alpha-glucan branching enzyme